VKPSKSPAPDAAPTRETILDELSRVSESLDFPGSARLKSLLQFLVAEVIAGRSAGLKGALIAQRFFGRGAGFDSAEDTIVRVEISKLRRALSQWYSSNGGALRIDIPPGSYVPRFLAADEPAVSGPRSIQRGLAPRGITVSVRPFATFDEDGAATLASSLASSLAVNLPERLAALMSRIAWLHVLQPSGGAAPDSGYAVEGSVRVFENTCRVMVSLREGSGRLVWGETYDRPITSGATSGGAPSPSGGHSVGTPSPSGGQSVGAPSPSGGRAHAIEDELLETIFMLLFDFVSGALVRAESLRIRRAVEPTETAFEANLCFLRWFWSFERQDYLVAREAAEAALEREPEHAPLLSSLADLHVVSLWTATADPHAQALASDLAHRALIADPTVIGPHIALALVHQNTGNGAGMREAAERAVAIGTLPGVAAWLLAISGAWERGTALLRHHIGLGLRVPGWYHHALFLDAFRRGDDVAALAEAQLVATPHLAWDPLGRAAALARLGRRKEARAAAAELTRILPAFAEDPRGHIARLVPDVALGEALLRALSLSGFEIR